MVKCKPKILESTETTMETILISGGTGLVGSELCKKLRAGGYRVAVLSRSGRPDAELPGYRWDPVSGEIEKEALEKADYIIHLAGAGIADRRWTAKRKKLIIDSRVKTGRLLFEKVKENNTKLKAFISASAVGYYGAVSSERVFCETDPPAADFLGETCRQWEEAADSFAEAGIRTVKIRTSVVLSARGGALVKMARPVKLGLGSAIGSGRQYLPWIHLDDLCGIYLKAVEDTAMNGAYNATAPEHISNRDFTRTLARVLDKPYFLPHVPELVLKILFGRMSSMLLKGSRVSADKIRSAGYSFLFPGLEPALTNLLAPEQSAG